ncbi:MAG: TlyA family RNA methyltransferase [Planctomycetota bacterium]|nr:MAG: TlyA family RNA methyltransferase [Planctomycetota bacterium]
MAGHRSSGDRAVSDAQRRFVSRAGHKLAAALDAFDIDPCGKVCIDFGSHTGGFVDCLLQRGAARVYAVDPGYGILDSTLRDEKRVVVCERTNALDFDPPEPAELLTCDVGWTPLRVILPAVRRCLATDGLAIVLVKPQYEAPKRLLKRGVLPTEQLSEVLAMCREDVRDLGWRVAGEIESPILGRGGNRELLWLLTDA